MDNALAECIIDLFKTEVINHVGPWRSMDQLEWATLKWVDWFNNERLLEPIRCPKGDCIAITERGIQHANRSGGSLLCKHKNA